MTEWVLTLNLARPPMSLNQQRRAHWTQVRKAKQIVEWHMKTALTRNPVPPIGRAAVNLVWWCPDNRRRDADSLAPTLKAALDALVANGVLEDDNHQHVPRVSMGIEIDQANPRITVTIEEIE